MKKRLLRLTEGDLHNIIKNVIKEICEIDDLKDQVISSDWNLQDGDGMKYQQMSNDWKKQEIDDVYDKKYFDQLYDDHYLNDYNRNVNDYWSEKDKLPF